jgi:hypothetical protein
MSKKQLKRGVIIQLLLPFAFYLFNVCFFALPAAASEKPDSQISGMMAMVKLAMAYKNGQAQLSHEELAAIKEEAFAMLDGVFQKIDEAGITVQDLKKYERILPQKVVDALSTLITVSRLNVSTEDKIAGMVGVFASCDSYLYTFLVLIAFNFVFGSIPVIGQLIYLGEVAFAVFTVLCYLGLV